MTNKSQNARLTEEPLPGKWVYYFKTSIQYY